MEAQPWGGALASRQPDPLAAERRLAVAVIRCAVADARHGNADAARFLAPDWRGATWARIAGVHPEALRRLADAARRPPRDAGDPERE